MIDVHGLSTEDLQAPQSGPPSAAIALHLGPNWRAQPQSRARENIAFGSMLLSCAATGIVRCAARILG